jgi:hypothetical protein
MSDTTVKIIISVISLGIAFWGFSHWRKKKNIWLLLSGVTATLAAAGSWLGPENGGFMAILAAALLFLGLWTKRGRG